MFWISYLETPFFFIGCTQRCICLKLVVVLPGFTGWVTFNGTHLSWASFSRSCVFMVFLFFMDVMEDACLGFSGTRLGGYRFRSVERANFSDGFTFCAVSLHYPTPASSDNVDVNIWHRSSHQFHENWFYVKWIKSRTSFRGLKGFLGFMGSTSYPFITGAQIVWVIFLGCFTK